MDNHWDLLRLQKNRQRGDRMLALYEILALSTEGHFLQSYRQASPLSLIRRHLYADRMPSPDAILPATRMKPL